MFARVPDLRVWHKLVRETEGWGLGAVAIWSGLRVDI